MKAAYSIPAVLAASLLATGTAMAAPLALAPGDSGTVPAYDGRTPIPTTLLDATCGFFDGSSCTTFPPGPPALGNIVATGVALLASTGGFLEAAGTTVLNPYGSSDVALGFFFAGLQIPLIDSVTVASLGGYATSVEACGPIFGPGLIGCAPGSQGTATRSGGSGDSIAFTDLADISDLVTDGYVIYTDAPTSALVDPPDNFTVVLNNFGRVGTRSFSFAGFALRPPSTAVPEPATLALLGLGLAGLGLTRRRKAR